MRKYLALTLAMVCILGLIACKAENPACKTIRITDDSGTQAIAIEKDAYPFIYYNEQIPSEYYCLDAEGNEIP